MVKYNPIIHKAPTKKEKFVPLELPLFIEEPHIKPKEKEEKKEEYSIIIELF
jgi:hypothetical protein